MEHQLSFERLLEYDTGRDGVTIAVSANAGLNQNVLGRHGWLERVVLGLVDYEGKLLLSRYSV